MTQLIELDLLMGDPNNWPAAVFAGLNVPKGLLPPSWRRWGAIRLAKQWGSDHGLVFADKSLRVHYHRHVHQFPQNVFDIAVAGAPELVRGSQLPVRLSPVTFRQYYEKGIELGYIALSQLTERVKAAQEKGDIISTDLLLKLADVGTKLATNAASLEMRGFELMRNKDDEMEGFRAGSMPIPSPRMGHHRVRVIDGVARPVVDEGRADRREFNERAELEGNTTLPA